MKNLLFIYNPVSGKGRAAQELSSAVDIFTKSGYLVTTCPTQRKGDATRIARELGKSYDRVVCAGGDGTLSETVGGLFALEGPPVLGYLPLGSTNDCAKNLCLPSKTAEAAAVAVRDGNPRLWDVGTLNGKPFFYIAAFGAFTEVAYETSQDLKNALGHMAYIVAGIAAIPTIKPYHIKVEYDGNEIEDDFLFGMVCNTVFVGGMKTLPEHLVSMDDGQFEVVLVRKPVSTQELFSGIQGLINGNAIEREAGSIIGFHASELKITGEREIPWTIDGEFGGKHEISCLKNHRRAITVVQGQQRG